MLYIIGIAILILLGLVLVLKRKDPKKVFTNTKKPEELNSNND